MNKVCFCGLINFGKCGRQRFVRKIEFSLFEDCFHRRFFIFIMFGAFCVLAHFFDCIFKYRHIEVIIRLPSVFV